MQNFDAAIFQLFSGFVFWHFPKIYKHSPKEVATFATRIVISRHTPKWLAVAFSPVMRYRIEMNAVGINMKKGSSARVFDRK